MEKPIGKIVVVFLILCYLAALFFYVIQFPYFVGWDGSIRAVWAAAFNDIFKSFFQGKYHALLDIYNKTIATYMDHYSMPLYFFFATNQLILFIFSFITMVLGYNYFTLSISNAIMFIAALTYLHKLTTIIYKDHTTAWLSLGLTATFPFVFNAIFGLDRGMGEMMFVAATLYYLIKFYETDRIKYMKYAFIALTLGFLFREAIIVMYLPLFVTFFVKENNFISALKKYWKSIVLFTLITLIIFGFLGSIDYFVNRHEIYGIFTLRVQQTDTYYENKKDIDEILTLNRFMDGLTTGQYTNQTPHHLPNYKMFIFLLSILFYNPFILCLFLVYIINLLLTKSFDMKQCLLWLTIFLYVVMLGLFDVIPEYTPPIYILMSVFLSYSISRFLSLFKKNILRISFAGILILFLLGYNITKFGFMSDGISFSAKKNVYDIVISAMLEEEKNHSEKYSVLVAEKLIRNSALSLLLKDETKDAHLISYDIPDPAREDWNKFLSLTAITTKMGRTKPPVKYVVAFLTDDILYEILKSRQDFKAIRKVSGYIRAGWHPKKVDVLIYKRENIN